MSESEFADRYGSIVRATLVARWRGTPYLVDLEGAVHYDSSALAAWLDVTHPCPEGTFFPATDEDPALAFVAKLIDEAFDEFGLYMVHHNR